jgi:hypothetical protein
VGQIVGTDNRYLRGTITASKKNIDTLSAAVHGKSTVIGKFNNRRIAFSKTSVEKLEFNQCYVDVIIIPFYLLRLYTKVYYRFRICSFKLFLI